MIRRITNRDTMSQYLECVSELMGSSKKPDVDIFYNRVMSMGDNYITYVYILDGNIVATCAVLYEYKLRYIQPKAYIEDVAVHPDHRGSGYGKEIVEYCYNEAKNRGAYKVVLTCSDELITYYESMGFQKDVNFMVK